MSRPMRAATSFGGEPSWAALRRRNGPSLSTRRGWAGVIGVMGVFGGLAGQLEVVWGRILPGPPTVVFIIAMGLLTVLGAVLLLFPRQGPWLVPVVVGHATGLNVINSLAQHSPSPVAVVGFSVIFGAVVLPTRWFIVQALATPAVVLAMKLDLDARSVYTSMAEALALTLGGAAVLVMRTRADRALARGLELANTDDLTGLANRRYLRDYAMTLAGRAGPVAALLIDLDHFKDVNDEHGHSVGDEVLAAVADALRAQCRPEDVAARWGGEEFLLLCPAADLDQARDRAEAVRLRISEVTLATPLPPVPVRCSIGVAAVVPPARPDGHGEWLWGLIGAADTALYSAKSAGRDQIATAVPPTAVPVPRTPANATQPKA